MRIPHSGFRSLLNTSIKIVCSLFVLFPVIPALGQQDFLSRPSYLWNEEDALKVLNNSPWAHSVTTSTQDAACGYKNPAFPGEIAPERAELLEMEAPTPPSSEVKSDGAEYLIRWLSVKPVQDAIQRLLVLDEKWRAYGWNFHRNDRSFGPTDVSRGHYNFNDMLTVSIILLKPGPGGASFIDYAFRDSGKLYPAKGLHNFICAGLRTANGVVYAHVGGPMGEPPDHSAITMSFPSQIEGRPLITKADERVEFRFVAMQRVFETTFTINAKDLLDGTQAGLYSPTAVTDLNEYSRSSVAANQ